MKKTPHTAQGAQLLEGLKWFTKKDCTIKKNDQSGRIYVFASPMNVPTTNHDLVNLYIFCGCDIILPFSYLILCKKNAHKMYVLQPMKNNFVTKACFKIYPVTTSESQSSPSNYFD